MTSSLGTGVSPGACLGVGVSLSAGLNVGLDLGCDRWALQQPLLIEKVQITRTLSFIVASDVSYD